MVNRRNEAERPKAALASDRCVTCGTGMRQRSSRLTASVNGETVSVPDSPHLGCPKCGEVILRLDEARLLHRRALELYRGKHGLLSAAEIRAIRERHGLTQGALAKLLKLGGNTISRWEAGRNVQAAAMDVLLRLIRDVPGSLDYLRSHAA